MIVAGALLYLGLFALAAATPRHGRILIGHRHTPAIGRIALAIGWLLLAASLTSIAVSPRWAFALIEWVGLVALLGGALALALAYGGWQARAGAGMAVGLLCASWLF